MKCKNRLFLNLSYPSFLCHITCFLHYAIRNLFLLIAKFVLRLKRDWRLIDDNFFFYSFVFIFVFALCSIYYRLKFWSNNFKCDFICQSLNWKIGDCQMRIYILKLTNFHFFWKIRWDECVKIYKAEVKSRFT